MYRVFLVEDEIVAREGIRQCIAWEALGFHFCGEASDGEMALPLIEAVRPEVVITDIKMPFMDGLQLSRLLREQMPDTRIIILSGHDEFQYAQEAIHLGVSEYLLKPFSAQDLEQVLRRVADMLRKDEAGRRQLVDLQHQAAASLGLRRQDYLVQLVAGALAPTSAVTQARELGLEVVAACYQVAVIRLAGQEPTGLLPGSPYGRTNQLLAAILQDARQVFVFPQGLSANVLLFTGSQVRELEHSSQQLLDMIASAVCEQTGGRLQVGLGAVVTRLSDLPHSLAQASAQLAHSLARPAPGDPAAASLSPASTAQTSGLPALPRLDRPAVEHYLRAGTKTEWTAFFDASIRPLAAASLEYRILLNYILVDLALATSTFVTQLGGDPATLLPETRRLEELVAGVHDLEQLRQAAGRFLLAALDFRDQQSGHSLTLAVEKARLYMEEHYYRPELSLQEVARQANLSPSHFSLVFSRLAGENFIDHLTRLRMHKAMELLRSTDLKTYAIARQVGYSDAHYFSAVFKKHTGRTPTAFRRQ